MSQEATVTTPRPSADTGVDVGVIGVGTMGQHHARIYRQLPDASLVGVTDIDTDQAASVAAANGTEQLDRSGLLEAVDAVSVAVPTAAHAEVIQACLDADIDVLVEKPFVDDIEVGTRLAAQASASDCVLQVGHIERFNPAVRTLFDVYDECNLIAGAAKRVGPPVDRGIEDGVIHDLMIHDIDIILALTGSTPVTVDAATNGDGQFATAVLTFPDGFVASLTASRLTHRRARRIEFTARDCLLDVDYLDQSVRIHRQSSPEYSRAEGNLRYRNESVVERPVVERGEPLKRELAAFLDAVRERSDPVVTAEDGLAVLEVAQHIERAATRGA